MITRLVTGGKKYEQKSYKGGGGGIIMSEQYNPENLLKSLNWTIFEITNEWRKIKTIDRKLFKLNFNFWKFWGSCRKCGLTFTNQMIFEEHFKANHDLYVCRVCFVVHSRDIVEKFMSSNGGYYCDRCSWLFSVRVQ